MGRGKWWVKDESTCVDETLTTGFTEACAREKEDRSEWRGLSLW